MAGRSPHLVYREFIDRLVAEVSSPAEQLLRDEGIYGRAKHDEPINSFARTLTAADRELVARICRAERVKAIHDVLAELTWLIATADVAITIRGVEAPVDESGMGLHGDFVGRLDDWEWPST